MIRKSIVHSLHLKLSTFVDELWKNLSGSASFIHNFWLSTTNVGEHFSDGVVIHKSRFFNCTLKFPTRELCRALVGFVDRLGMNFCKPLNFPEKAHLHTNALFPSLTTPI